ncbi:ABC transporter ATP-binding protein [Bosea sp. 2KB_26]|uniref:ABC transporter ATP-binding protein n=1 Tax=Bosea sp. 2KB_26 TaxID=3237475 RepID=UPI003F8F301F
MTAVVDLKPFTADQAQLPATLELSGIAHSFGGFKVLTDVNFAVPQGRIVGLIGPNGSGKSTCFNIVSGFLRPKAGRVLLSGRDIAADSIQARTRHGLMRTFQTPKVFERMSVLENVMVGLHQQGRSGIIASMLRTPAARRELDQLRNTAEQACRKFGLDRLLDEQTGRLPAGLRRVVELARAYVGAPRLMLLDEPSSGLNTEEIEQLRGWIAMLNSEGMTILLVSHDMGLMTIADTVHALYFGEIIASGPMAAIRAHPRVREAYLGG